jgi:hypothetical protein
VAAAPSSADAVAEAGEAAGWPEDLNAVTLRELAAERASSLSAVAPPFRLARAASASPPLPHPALALLRARALVALPLTRDHKAYRPSEAAAILGATEAAATGILPVSVAAEQVASSQNLFLPSHAMGIALKQWASGVCYWCGHAGGAAAASARARARDGSCNGCCADGGGVIALARDSAAAAQAQAAADAANEALGLAEAQQIEIDTAQNTATQAALDAADAAQAAA